MVLSKERLIISACLIFAYVLAFIGYYFTPSKLSTISYICQYNSASIILKNSQGKVMVVGDCYLIERIMLNSRQEFDIFVANKGVTAERYSVYEDFGINHFLCYFIYSN